MFRLGERPSLSPNICRMIARQLQRKPKPLTKQVLRWLYALRLRLLVGG